MKHNWTYKKLGEVVTIERGGSPRPIQDYITTAENGLNWIKIGDAVEGSKYITSTKEKIKPEGLKKTRFVHKGDFILSNSMSFGRPYILGIDGCIHDGWLVLHDEKEIFDKSYLYYYLSSPSIYAEFKRLAVGGVVNNLNSDIVRKVRVAIPSKEEQQAIVRELDGINHLIDLQEEQLREYDRLAQSLFYSTFGDPTTNPKGWEVKKLGEVAVIRDGSHNPPKGVDEPTEYRMLSSQNIFDNLIDYSKGVRYLSKENFELEHKRTNLKAGDVLLTIVGTIGRACIVTDKDTNITLQRSVAVLSPKDDILSIYLNRLLFVIGEKLQYESRGVAQKGIYLGQLSKTQIPVPPLALQQSFAAQIEAIEKQKALIRCSLDETRTLLAARMQYYFE